jgi:hypothetical protein
MHANEYVRIFETATGTLRVTLTAEGRSLIEEARAHGEPDDPTLATLLEWHLCNGWDLLDADLIGALSNAPILTRDLDWNETGAWPFIRVAGEWWYFEPYQVRSVVDDLLAHGVAIFTKGA